MKDRVSNLYHECINLKEVEVRIDVGLGQTMYIKVFQDIIKTLEVEQGTVQIIEVLMVKMQGLFKGIGEIIITIIEEVMTGIEVTIGIGVDHMKGRVEIGEIIGV